MNITFRITALSAIAATTILAGCTKEIDNGGFKKGSALSIGTVTTERMLTRSVITGTAFPADEAAKGIGLFLTATNGGNYDGQSAGYSNIKYSDGGSGWVSDSPIMLSATEGVLYGYFPYSASVTDLTVIPVESSLDGTDYMHAVPVTNVSKASSSLSLTMKHALARVSVKFIKDGSYTGAGALTAFSMESRGFSSSGKMNAKTGAVTPDGANSVSYTVAGTLTGSGIIEECLLVPTTDADRSLTLKCTIDGREYSVEFDGTDADTLCIRQGINSTATVTLKDKGLSISGTDLRDWKEGTLEIELDGGQKVTVKLSEETGFANDALVDIRTDGSTVTIKALAVLSGRFSKCTCTPDGKASCTPSTDAATGICTFTITDVQEDITAEVGYLKCNAAAVYDSDLGTVNLNGDGVASGTSVQFFGGEEVKFLAEAKSGCEFVKWTDGGGVELSTDNSYTIPRISSDITLNAIFGYEIAAAVKPAAAGTVTGAGTYPKGSNITLTATPAGSSGVTFIGWVDQKATADTIKQNPYSFTVSQSASYFAVFRLPEEALPGLFTVNDSGKKVRFSKGNLWCDGTGDGYTDAVPVIKSWGFEANQYDSNPASDGNRSISHISHFMWCKRASESVKQQYAESGAASGDTFFADDSGFSVNGVSTWRTLKMEEWKYLLETRTMTYSKPGYTNTVGSAVTIDGVTCKGLFIYPDDYNGSVVGSGGPSTWADINAAGIVFLPASGLRKGNSGVANIINVGDFGYYWSGSLLSDNLAYNLYFKSDNDYPVFYPVFPNNNNRRYYAYSVRLVADY